LFLTTVAAMALTEVLSFARTRDRAAAVVLVSLGVSLVIARLIGGFFSSGLFPAAGGLLGTGLVLREFSGTRVVLTQMQWNSASFGALLLLGGLGILRARRGRAFLVILAAVGLVTVNLLRYEYTWDIVKFAAVGFIVLAIGAGLSLAALTQWADTWSRSVVCGLIVVAVVGQGVLYSLFATLLYDPEGRTPLSIQMIRPYLSRAYPLDQDDDGRAVSFLRIHMRPSEIVYRAEAKSQPYAIWGGLPTQASVYPADSGDNDAYGLGKKKFVARADLSRISETWFDRLAAEHVSWLVTDPKDVAINAVLQGNEEQARVALAAQFGEVRVFRLQ
jgi:hypothetical protein